MNSAPTPGKWIPHDITRDGDDTPKDNGIPEEDLLAGIELVKVKVLIRADNIPAQDLEPLDVFAVKSAVLDPDQECKDQGDEEDEAEEVMNRLGAIGPTKYPLEDIQGAEHESEPCDHANHTASD